MALDRILLGHQHRQILPKPQILGAKSVVVGERVFDQPQPGVPQVIEEPPRIADARHRVDGALPKPGQRGADAGIAEIERGLAAQRHQIFPAARRAVADHEIHLAQPGGRLPQRSGGQARGVAQPAKPVHHGDFDIAAQAVVLQAVVAEDDVAIVGLEQRPRRRHPIRPHHHRTAAAPRQQHRLVADFARIAVGTDSARPFGRPAAVATTDHAGFVAGFAQQFHQPRHQRGLARAADADVADHDDRDAEAHALQYPVLVQEAPRSGRRAEQQAERPEQHGDQIQRISVTVQPVHDQRFGDGGASGLTAGFGGFDSPAVAMASCRMPSWPATSSTVTTA